MRQRLIRRVRVGQLSEAELQTTMADVLSLPVALLSVEDEAILRISTALRHHVYDCAYVALARQLDLRLVTADKRLIEAVRGTEFARHVVLLADYDPPPSP